MSSSYAAEVNGTFASDDRRAAGFQRGGHGRDGHADDEPFFETILIGAAAAFQTAWPCRRVSSNMEIAMLSGSATVAEGVKSVSKADGGRISPGETGVDETGVGDGYRLPARAAGAGKITLGGGYRLPIQGG